MLIFINNETRIFQDGEYTKDYGLSQQYKQEEKYRSRQQRDRHKHPSCVDEQEDNEEVSR